MKKALLRLAAVVLSMAMLTAFIPTAYAERADNEEMSTFDFGASDYSFNENDGTATIKIVRSGTGNAATKVLFKAADLISEYGEDYEIINEKGKKFGRVEGYKPDPSEFVFSETGEDEQEEISEEEAFAQSVKEGVEEQIASIDAADETKIVTKHNTGSRLLDARADYLGLPGSTATQDIADNTTQLLDELYQYYESAQGADCVVEFGIGEVEKEITIKINDNGDANSQKMFSLCIMATDNELTTIAPNATTYVTIQDDEETVPADYAIVEDGICLSSKNPTGVVTIRRTGGTMYFSTVTVSTVIQSAPEDSYEKISDKTVAFVPGQTEATVDIKALNFWNGGKFGIRLDADNDIDTLSKYYTDVTIVPDSGEIRERSSKELKAMESGEQPDAEQLASYSENIVGTSTSFSYFDKAWRWCTGGSGSDGKFEFEEFPNSYYVMDLFRSRRWGTWAAYNEKEVNLAGVKKISGDNLVKGTGYAFQRAFVPNYTAVAGNTTFYNRAMASAHSSNWSYGRVATQATNGNWRTSTYSLDVSDYFDTRLVALGIESGADPGSTASEVRYSDSYHLEWQKYTFDHQKSATYFQRTIYDFSQGVPTQPLYTYFDGSKSKNYYPGEAIVETSYGSEIGGFYANYGGTVYIRSRNAEKEAANGLYLKGVYFVKSGTSARDMDRGENKYRPTGGNYYLPVDSISKDSDDPYVSVTLDQDFVKKLADSGIVSANDTKITIYPEYTTRDITVDFYNTDANGSRVLYDEDHRYSEVRNIVDAYASDSGSILKFEKKTAYKYYDNCWEGCDVRDYYITKIPSGSVLRMSIDTVTSRVPDGISVYDKKTQTTSHLWYKYGDTVYDEIYPAGVKIKSSDYTMAELVVTHDMEITPVTDTQSLEIRYFPREVIPEQFTTERTVNGKTIKGLEYAVVTTETFGTENVKGTDENGYYKLPEAFSSKEWSFTANPPAGYTTKWVDFTGDLNGDGYIDETEKSERRRVSKTPPEVYGNVMSGKIDADKMLIYYEFVPTTSVSPTRLLTGTITRENANFIQVLNKVATKSSDSNLETSSDFAVNGVMVNVGGNAAYTDYLGKFTMDANLPRSGIANVVVTAEDGTNYYSYLDLREHADIVMPALEQFTAGNIKATMKVNDKTSEIKLSESQGVISAEDGECIVQLTVGSDTIIAPKKAHFFILDKDRDIKVVCDEDTEAYKVVNKTKGKTLVTSLTFNPKKDCFANYELWVQFEDAGGKLYSMISTGLKFSKPLDLASFAFPLIGSSSLENFYKSDFVSDLIGDPLGDVSVGKIGLESESRLYAPASLSPEAQKRMTWTQYSYSYSWGKDYKLVDKKWGDKKKKDSDSDKGKSSDDDWEIIDKPSDNDDWEVIDKSQLDKDAEDTLGETANKLLDSDQDQFADKTGEDKKKGKEETKSGFKTKGSFSFSITPSIGFRLTLSQRSDLSKYYFEDLLFYAKLSAKLSLEQKIATPIGITIMMGFGISGDITGIYYMYNSYNGDPNEGGYGKDLEDEDLLVPYTSEDFGLFKKFDDSSPIRREFYLFIDPSISISLGVDVAIASVTVTAKFNFDFDFRWTKWDTYAYGDLKIFMSYEIKVLGFTVWEDSIGSKDGLATFEIFKTDNQNGHISFDPTKPFTRPSFDAGAEDEEDKFATDDVASRAYLANRTAWNGTPDTPLSNKGSTEITLENGSATDAHVKLMKINDEGDMLMVFVDDDPDRSDINRRAVYYSIGSGENWTTPKIIKNDGTLDDYPDICEAGEGRLLVTWSSADRKLKDGEGVEDALKALDIQAAFFDTNTKTFGKVETLTKTTDEDFTADFNPHAAYDEATNKIILYYTKTEYEGLEKIEDIGSAASVTAYLFYEDGKWSNDGSAYTDEELADVRRINEQGFIEYCEENGEEYTAQDVAEAGEEGVEYYREQWYGQRFLDLRIKSESELNLEVDTAAIGYNGLGLFAWTIDWDKDLTTNDDRDVFLQIYDFEDELFTHVIKLTNETGVYTTPQFARSNDSTYLFFGAMNEDSEGNQKGEIDYINISDTIKNDYYTLVTAGERNYYELVFTVDDGEGGDRVITVDPNTAVMTDNIEDYAVTVGEDGKMYIIWAQNDETRTAAQINAAYFLGDNAQGSSWSNAVKLTDAPDDIYYSGIGAAVVGSDLKIGAVRSSFVDDADNSLVFINHVPYSDITISGISCDSEYPMAGDKIDLTAEVTNNGLLGYNGIVQVNFTLDGEQVAANTVSEIAGATTVPLSAQAICPDSENNILAEASTTFNGTEISSGMDIKKQAELGIADEEINLYRQDYSKDTYYAYTAEVANVGNKDSGEVTFEVTAGSKLLGTATIDNLAPLDTQPIKIVLDIDNSMFTLDEDFVGSLDTQTVAYYGDLESEAYEQTITKSFDKETAQLLDSVTAITFENDGKYTLPANREEEIMPTITGVDDGKLKVVWTETSNPDAVTVYNDSTIITGNAGTATLTGFILPYKQKISINGIGNSSNEPIMDEIPADRVKKVTVEVTVESTALLGDLDGDGTVSSADALIALRISTGLDEANDETLRLGDIDGDGQITSADALAILRYSVDPSTSDKIGKAA